MNPYDFVRINWDHTPTRIPATTHERFSGLTGTIKCTLSAETPIFIPDKRFSGEPKRFIKNEGGRGVHIIPGSSLKGLVRALVETIGPGCWCTFDGRYGETNYTQNLPEPFRKCERLDALCIACRLFGMLGREKAFQGKVSFSDATCTASVAHKSVYTPILDAPKPRHSVWYLKGDKLSGRKFYFHQQEPRTLKDLKRSAKGVPLNQYIEPLNVGTKFDFSLLVQNLRTDDEWPLLLYALALEDGVRHKIGYAKSAGFGSVHINITEIRVVDLRRRYVENVGTDSYQEAALVKYLQAETQAFLNNSSITLNDLRRIWRWPPPEGIEYAYPSRTWFDQNSHASITETP